ncbi:MAG TPA: RNA polymerase sigma factor RpoD [Clostridiales bacterium]|nr:RNA polymerase sigma factor RpoD [Clostridiales bacterium]HBK25501.1 RNA polymerase sigma factor RpoD [Clostridiales bacterium]HCP71330.1 RNA polymerase sigma factor RpoD [Clostridiales bacterium]
MTELLENSPVSAGEDDVRQYLNEIRRYPRLTPEEERELAKRCAQGDESAIRQMVNSNLRLVVSIAREYAGRGVALMDLIQEGSIGLLVAARKFDYTKDYRFSTYATKWIRQGVTRCLMNHGSTIRVPLHTAERMRKIEAVRTSLRQELGEEPTAAQIAEKCGLPEEKVAELTQLTPDICSLDVPMGDDDGTALQSLLEDAQAPQPYEEVVRGELDKTMDRLLGSLNERQQQILRLHFGMEDGHCYSLEEIGKKLGISKERVRQIERQAMDKLQKMGAGLGLEDFLNE